MAAIVSDIRLGMWCGDCSMLSGVDLSSDISLVMSALSTSAACMPERTGDCSMDECVCPSAFASKESTLKLSFLVGVGGGEAVVLDIVIADDAWFESGI